MPEPTYDSLGREIEVPFDEWGEVRRPGLPDPDPDPDPAPADDGDARTVYTD